MNNFTKIMLISLMVISLTACSNKNDKDVDDTAKQQYDAISFVDSFEMDTRSCVEFSDNKNTTALSLMGVCQIALNKYQNLSMSSVAKITYNLPKDEQERFINILTNVENSIIKSKKLENNYTGNKYVQRILINQEFAAKLISVESNTLKNVSESTKKVDEQ